MIKVNLLDSVTDRARSVAVVEEKVASPKARTGMLLVVVAALTALGMGFEYMSANHQNEEVKAELERQEQIAAKMADINKQQGELEKKIEEVKKRINAIKTLRASQQGPVAILSEINSRLPQEKDFSLTSVEQKGGELIVEGHSPNEDAVTQFARSLEFSSNLFSDVSIETERKVVEPADTDWTKDDGEVDPDAPKPEIVRFKVTCKYAGASAPAAPAAQNPPATSQVAQK
jgi:Tfp pilus assembly protein PilN